MGEDNEPIDLSDQAEVETLISDLWDKHAHADRHGYRDWMGEDAFGAAVCELIDDIAKGKYKLPVIPTEGEKAHG